MKLSINKQRFKLFVALGGIYAFFWILGELSSNPDTFFRRAWNHIWLVSYLVALNYILLEHTVPFIRLSWKRILLGLLFLWLHLMLYSFGFYAWRAVGITMNLYFEVTNHKSVLLGVEYHVPYAFGSVVFFTIGRHIHDHRRLKLQAQQLLIEKQQAELNYLKAQTNPHFLFNTLNNIYSLARDKSDLTADSVMRLSKILRFMLYETNGKFIGVEQELKIINDYIELEKLRYDESLNATFHYDVEDMKQAIPPLLLIPLVENAFKHGASESVRHPFVDIHLSLKARRLIFTVKNSCDTFTEEGSRKESIGLSNLRRQLELLYSENNLQLEQNEGVFTATLQINLASHV
jgi:two-component system, LytTR family, sensor kinase